MKKFKKLTAIVLSFAMIFTTLPASVFASTIIPAKGDGYVKDAEWYNFRNNQENNGITEYNTPIDKNETYMRFAAHYGTGWSSSPTPPLILDGYLYTMVNNKILKLDKKTGIKVDESDPLIGTAGYGMQPITYGDGKFFVQIGKGVVEAVDYKTLKTLWHTPEVGGQTLSTVAYTKVNGKGYIYTGNWKNESIDGSYICATTDNSNIVETEKENIDGEKYIDREKQLTWEFIPSRDDPEIKKQKLNPRGFYWSGAYACENYIAFGSDDGQGENNYKNEAAFYTLNPTTGKIIDSIHGVKGDIRCNVVYDNGYLYFNTKGGELYKVEVDKKGHFGKIQKTDVGGMSTGTPVVYENKIYLGVAGKGGQFDPGAGHRFAVFNNDGPLEEMYSIPIPGYPQAGALISTAHVEDDYDGDGLGDGRVYIYFTYNAFPGGIYYTYDTPDGTDIPEETGEIFVPEKQYQQHCISTIIADKEGTLYYKNDTCNIFAVEINPAYLTDIRLTSEENNKANFSPKVIPQVSNYTAKVVTEKNTASLEIDMPKGVTATVNDNPYNVDAAKPYKKGMKINISDQKTSIEITTKKEGKTRKYKVSIERQLEDPYLGSLQVTRNNNNLPDDSNSIEVKPGLKTDVFNYSVDITDLPSSTGFYNLWVKPHDASSKIEVFSKNNINLDKTENGIIKGYSNGRYPVYYDNEDKPFSVIVKVTTKSGLTSKEYTITFKKTIKVRDVKILNGDFTTPVNSEVKMEAVVVPNNATNQNISWNAMSIDEKGDPVEDEFATINSETGVLSANKAGKVSVAAIAEDNGKSAISIVTIIDEGWYETPDNQKKYVFKGGVPAVGLSEIDGSLYYFDENGYMQTGFQNVNGKPYYFENDGKAASEKWIDLEDSSKVYCRGNGELATGKYKIGNITYNFDQNGKFIDIVPGFIAENGNTKYINSDGSYADGYLQIGDSYYYFKNNIMQKGYCKISGAPYYFGEDGKAAAKGWIVDEVQNARYYSLGEGRLAVGENVVIEGISYNFDADGKYISGSWEQVGNSWKYKNPDGTYAEGYTKILDTYYYFKENIMQTGHQMIDGKPYYFVKEGMAAEKGWITDNDKKMYSKGDGALVTGTFVLDGITHYFNDEGFWTSQDAKWIDTEEGKKYQNNDGIFAEGYTEIEGSYYYFDKDNIMQTGHHIISNAPYYFGEDGKAAEKGWITGTEGKKLFYSEGSGRLLTGNKVIDGIPYYFDHSGAFRGETEGWVEENGEKKYYTGNGKFATGFKTIDGDGYFFDENNYMVKEWQTIDDNEFYFGPDGKMRKNQWIGEAYVGKYVGKDGRYIPNRWENDTKGTKYIYGDETPHGAGFDKINGATYYFNDEGYRLTGWNKIKGKNYYFDKKTGKMAVSKWVGGEGQPRYVGDDGAALTGKQKIDGYIYYFNDEGVRQTGLTTIDGKPYMFKSDGKAETKGWKKNSSGVNKYYCKGYGELTTGKVKIGSYTYYFNEKGYMQTGLEKIGTRYYFFKTKTGVENGRMVTGKIKLTINGKTGLYYFGPNGGSYNKGWFTISGKTMYSNGNGSIKTGKVKIGSRWYYFGTDGIRKSGAWKINGKLNYFGPKGGNYNKGWFTVNGKTRYSNGDGTIKTGKVKIGSRWYYFGTDGIRKSGKWRISGKLNYFGPKGGSYNKGWIKDTKGRKMYSYGDGRVATGRVKIGGKYYRFNSYGNLI